MAELTDIASLFKPLPTIVRVFYRKSDNRVFRIKKKPRRVEALTREDIIARESLLPTENYDYLEVNKDILPSTVAFDLYIDFETVPAGEIKLVPLPSCPVPMPLELEVILIVERDVVRTHIPVKVKTDSDLFGDLVANVKGGALVFGGPILGMLPADIGSLDTFVLPDAADAPPEDSRYPTRLPGGTKYPIYGLNWFWPGIGADAKGQMEALRDHFGVAIPLPYDDYGNINRRGYQGLVKFPDSLVVRQHLRDGNQATLEQEPDPTVEVYLCPWPTDKFMAMVESYGILRPYGEDDPKMHIKYVRPGSGEPPYDESEIAEEVVNKRDLYLFFVVSMETLQWKIPGSTAAGQDDREQTESLSINYTNTDTGSLIIEAYKYLQLRYRGDILAPKDPVQFVLDDINRNGVPEDPIAAYDLQKMIKHCLDRKAE